MSYLDGVTLAEQRMDALKCKTGKKCGDICIPRKNTCKSEAKSPSAIATGAGLLAGGVLLKQGARQVDRQINRKIQQPIDEMVDKAVDKTVETIKSGYKKVKNKIMKKKERK